MHIFRIILSGAYTIFSIFVGIAAYIYVTVGIGGDTFIGICFFAIACIFAALIYKVVEWACCVSSSSADSSPSVLSSLSPKLLLPDIPPRQEETAHDSPAAREESVAEEKPLPVEKPAAEVQMPDEMAIENAKDRVSRDFINFLPDEEMATLMSIIDDYAHKRMPAKSIDLPLSQLNGLTIIDLYHFGWNIWFLLKPMRRRTTCRFLKKAFPVVLREISEGTIYAKMTIDYGAFSIKLIEKEESRR
ncbi:MAG: hypothetical protein LUC26_03400 [Prevotella sp.]|nr:hypothetical protein [Prevotella sp.]